jgi:TonB family protein
MKKTLLASILIHAMLAGVLFFQVRGRELLKMSIPSEIELIYASRFQKNRFIQNYPSKKIIKTFNVNSKKNQKDLAQDKKSEEQLESVKIIQTNSGSENNFNSMNEFIEYRPSPHYPMDALAEKLEGDILIEVKTDRSGFIEKIEIIRGSGHTILDNEALETVKNWRLKPLKKIRVPINFHLNS